MLVGKKRRVANGMLRQAGRGLTVRSGQ